MEKSSKKDFVGVIIEESLENKAVLQKVAIVKTRVAQVNESHQTPWLEQWTLYDVEIPEGQAEQIAEEISLSLDPEHGASWYADFRNADEHLIIFRRKIFKIDRSNPEQYVEATQYGLSLGIPAHQLDFSPMIKEREI
jgi:hypothetical protein